MKIYNSDLDLLHEVLIISTIDGIHEYSLTDIESKNYIEKSIFDNILYHVRINKKMDRDNNERWS